MKKSIFIVASLLVFAACNKEVLNAPQENCGILQLSVQSDDNIKVTTKAGGVNTDNFDVKIIDSQNNVEKTGKASTLTVVVLPADTYTISAENISESLALESNDGKGALRMAGSVSVPLGQSETKSVTLNCQPTNSKITVSYDDTFVNAFNTYSVNLDHNGDRDFTSITADADYFYNITSDAYVDVKLTAKSKANVDVTHTQKVDLAVGYHYAITYMATPDGQLSVSITASDALTSSPVEVPVNPYAPAPNTAE